MRPVRTTVTAIFGNNDELQGKDLYWNNTVFKPELGNKSLGKEILQRVKTFN